LSELQPRVPAADIRDGRRQLVGAYVVSIQGRSASIVEQENLALTAAFDASAAGDPSNSVSLPNLDLMLPTFAAHPCIFSCPHSIGSTLFRTLSREGDSASVSATVAALEDAYTKADLFETVCQIRGDELDDAGTYELLHHIRGKATPEEPALGSFTRRKLKQLLNSDLWLTSEWKQVDAH
jgi:hypothetical protein